MLIFLVSFLHFGHSLYLKDWAISILNLAFDVAGYSLYEILAFEQQWTGAIIRRSNFLMGSEPYLDSFDYGLVVMVRFAYGFNGFLCILWHHPCMIAHSLHVFYLALRYEIYLLHHLFHHKYLTFTIYF